jgi:hypothetical protein
MEQIIEWIESEGGPLLLAPKSKIGDWLGSLSANSASGPTDYERACAVQDEIGLIPIGNDQQAIVLGDEPDRTTLLARTIDELLIIRWRWAESEKSLLSALSSALGLDAMSFNTKGTFTAQAEEYLLFDSAYSGAEITRNLTVELQAGTYSLETVLFNPSKNTCALIHRMRLINSENA